MELKQIRKEIYLPEGIDVLVDIDIPLSINVLSEKDDSMMDEMLINQVYRGIKGALEDYRNSELPDKFLVGQKFIITNKMPLNTHGRFYLIGDDIMVDADSISGIRRIDASFLLGHEMGHKYEKYLDLRDAYEAIANMLGMSTRGNEHLLLEIFADECGNIAINNLRDSESQIVSMSEDKRKYLQRKILGSIYHI